MKKTNASLEYFMLGPLMVLLVLIAMMIMPTFTLGSIGLAIFGLIFIIIASSFTTWRIIHLTRSE